MNDVIREFALQPHPEGGFFRETYRAAATVPGTGRSVCTGILFLLQEGQRSRLHRIDADELWHFYRGGPLVIVELQDAAPPRETVLSAQQPQHLVPAGTWFGAHPAEGSAGSLVGCTVSPGFEFAHFELGTRAALLEAFPQGAQAIHRLTPEAR